MKNIKIIGGGIAGCSCAYFFKKAGYDVELFEENKICLGGSFAAGAFLSPKISKPSKYKEYLNTALKFTLDLYQNEFNHAFKKTSLLKFPKDDNDWQRFLEYEKYIDFDYKKHDKFFELFLAGIVDPKELCFSMLDGIKYHEDYKVKDLKNFKDSIIIIATPNQTFLNEPYLKTKNIGGYRYDVLFKDSQKLKSNMHKSVSISAFFKNKNIIGASFIRKKQDLLDLAKKDSENILKEANKIKKLEDLKILKIYTGYRNMTFDFFPILGEMVDAKSTLEKYPYIKNGTKIPPQKYIYHKNIYLHTALASRGFVFAPYNAFLLLNLIKNKKNIPWELQPARLFKKYANKLK